MADFDVRGADDFLRVSKALKAAGLTDVRKELHKGIRKAARPLIPKVRAEARKRLPRSGGLAEQVAREPMRIAVRTGNDPGVRVVVGKKRGGAQAANRGAIRHPVFGQDVWVEQRVSPGWFDDPIRGSVPEIRRDIERSMRDVVNTIARKGD